MNKEERDALKKLEKVYEGQLLLLLATTEMLVTLCESMEKALDGVKILARQPEGVEHEPTPKIEPEPEEYDGYVSYTEFIEQPENRRVIKGRIKHVEKDPPQEDSADAPRWPDVLEATPEEWAEYERLEAERRIQEWGWIG